MVDGPPASVIIFLRCAPVAQLDRASGYEPEGREFDSLRARHSCSPTGVSVAVVETVGRPGLASGTDIVPDCAGLS
jgi:hypothetical protein